MIEKIIYLGTHYPIMAFATLLPFFILLAISFSKISLDSSMKIIHIYVILFFLSDIPLWITTGLKINNVIYNHVREVLLSMYLIGIYYFIINSKLKQRYIIGTEVFLAVLGVASLFYKPYPSSLIFIYKIAMIPVVFLHFHSIISELRITKLLNYPFFWISSGVLIFSCGSLLVTLFYRYTIGAFHDAETFKLYSQFLDFMVVIMFIFIGVGFLNANKKYT